MLEFRVLWDVSSIKERQRWSNLHLLARSYLFLSTTSCHCGVYGAEHKPCSTSYSSQNDSKSWLSNSPPWSLLIQEMLSPLSFGSFLATLANACKASFFWARKRIQVNLEYSSIVTGPHLFPPRLSVLVGPYESMGNICEGWLVERKSLTLQEILTY